MSMGAGKPKFRICETMSAGWKKNSTPETARQTLAQLANVLRRGMMMFLIQRPSELPRRCANHARVAIGKIDTGIRQPMLSSIVCNSSFGISLRSTARLHRTASPFPPRAAGAGAEMQPHQPASTLREEILPRKNTRNRESTQKITKQPRTPAMFQRCLQQLLVSVTELVEAALEPALIFAAR
jgi:hypothetical protein